jgi:hypothetical protein
VAIVSLHVSEARASSQNGTLESVAASVLVSMGASYLVVMLHARCDDGIDCKLALLVKRRCGHACEGDAKDRFVQSLCGKKIVVGSAGTLRPINEAR